MFHFRIIEQILAKDQYGNFEPEYHSFVFVNKKPVAISDIPKRLATMEERREMFGSVGVMYETRVPILYCPEYRKFFLVDYFKHTAIVFDKDVELFVLRANNLLPSAFRKMTRKEKQDWNSSLVKDGISKSV